MSFNGTSVGLDVHALSVVARAFDEETGRVERARCPRPSRSVDGEVGELDLRESYEQQQHSIDCRCDARP